MLGPVDHHLHVAAGDEDRVLDLGVVVGRVTAAAFAQFDDVLLKVSANPVSGRASIQNRIPCQPGR